MSGNGGILSQGSVLSFSYLHPVAEPLESWSRIGGLGGAMELHRLASGGDRQLRTAGHLGHVDFRLQRRKVHLQHRGLQRHVVYLG